MIKVFLRHFYVILNEETPAYFVFGLGLACQAEVHTCHTKISAPAKSFTGKTSKSAKYLGLDIIIILKFATNFDNVLY